MRDQTVVTQVGNTSFPVSRRVELQRRIMESGFVSLWLNARAAWVKIATHTVVEWIDRARGLRFVVLGTVGPAGVLSGDLVTVTFNGGPQAMLAEDALDMISVPSTYSLVIVTRQTIGSFGGAPIGTMGTPAEVAYPWMSNISSAMSYFTKGVTDNVLNNGLPQNDGLVHVNIVSIDTNQIEVSNKSKLYLDQHVLWDNSGTPAEMSSASAARRWLLGAAGPRGAEDTFKGQLIGVMILDGIALHLPEHAALMADVQDYWELEKTDFA